MNTGSRIRTYSTKKREIIIDFRIKSNVKFYQAPNGNVNRARLALDEFGDVLDSISLVSIISSSLSSVIINSLSDILFEIEKQFEIINVYIYM